MRKPAAVVTCMARTPFQPTHTVKPATEEEAALPAAMLAPPARLYACGTRRTPCFIADAIRLSSQPVCLAATPVTQSIRCPLPSGDHHYCLRP